MKEEKKDFKYTEREIKYHRDACFDPITDEMALDEQENVHTQELSPESNSWSRIEECQDEKGFYQIFIKGVNDLHETGKYPEEPESRSVNCKKRASAICIAEHDISENLNTLGNCKKHITSKENADTLGKTSANYSCAHCKYTSNSIPSLKRHVTGHLKGISDSCKFCDYNCSDQYKLRVHLNSHKHFSCGICGYKCCNVFYLKTHCETHAGEGSPESDSLKVDLVNVGEKSFRCHLCNYECSCKTLFENHIRMHAIDQVFLCEFCGYRCETSLLMKRHHSSHAEYDLCSCEFCNKICKRLSSLEDHLMIYPAEDDVGAEVDKQEQAEETTNAIGIAEHDVSTDKARLTKQVKVEGNLITSGNCEKCITSQENSNTIFITEDDVGADEARLTKQIKLEGNSITLGNCEKPKENAVTVEPTLGGKIGDYCCVYCEYRSNYVTSLKTHVTGHLKGISDSCKFCDFKCSDQFKLQFHLNSHKHYSCRFCGYKCCNVFYLRTHCKTHAVERSLKVDVVRKKSFRCLQCNYECSCKTSLQNHIKMHAIDNILLCEFCGHRSKSNFHFSRHHSTHAEHERSSCEFCNQLRKRPAVHDVAADKASLTKEVEENSTTSGNCEKHITSVENANTICVAGHDVSTGKTMLTKQDQAEENSISSGNCEKCITSKDNANNNEKTSGNFYCCAHCEYTSDSVPSLKKHVAGHLKCISDSCTFCDYQCSDQFKLQFHLNSHKHYSCGVCGYKSCNAYYLRTHCKTHAGLESLKLDLVNVGEKSFRCRACNYECSCKSSLRNHMRKKHKRQVLCELCGTTGFLLKNHNCSQNLLSCEFCNRKYKNSSTLKAHLEKHAAVKTFSCELCDYKIHSSFLLEFHLRSHKTVKRFSCDICDFKCSNRSSLKVHTLYHTGEFPFSCSLCDYKCPTSNHLRSHLRKHRGEKRYSCASCDYKTDIKNDLRKHIARRHIEKTISCEYCDYKCSHTESLRIHMDCHAKDRRYSCLLCPYKSVRSCYLKRHLEIHNRKQ